MTENGILISQSNQSYSLHFLTCFLGNKYFEVFDQDTDGYISMDEWFDRFSKVMDYLGVTSINEIELDGDTYREVFNSMDCDKDQNINSTEFSMIMNGKVKVSVS